MQRSVAAGRVGTAGNPKHRIHWTRVIWTRRVEACSTPAAALPRRNNTVPQDEKLIPCPYPRESLERLFCLRSNDGARCSPEKLELPDFLVLMPGPPIVALEVSLELLVAVVRR